MNKSPRSILIGILLSGIPVLYLIGLQALAGSSLSLSRLLLYLVFIFATLAVAKFVLSTTGGIVIIVLVLINAVLYGVTKSTTLAWTLIGLYFSLLLWASWRLSASQSTIVKGLLYGIFCLLAGLIPVVALQIETRFSEEEFTALLQVAGLMILWGLLAISHLLWNRWDGKADDSLPQLNLAPILAALSLLIIAVVILTIITYQRSFYPPRAPTFEGITAERPYICGESNQQPTNVTTGEEIFADILALVEANPNKQVIEYGMLALGLNSPEWANQFRDSILSEARQAKFTKPANSVKYSQYQAALRVYYYARIRESFPQFFSPQETGELDQWFADINRRAQSIEWVDWLYAIAYGKLPEGPYENQEIGAGLLSLLELEGLSDPGLIEKNRAYLDKNQRGWAMRFRNTDDAAVYQPEWINNAYFQSLYSGALDPDNLENSYTWLLLQTIPDGAPLRYNHIGAADFATTAYQGAGFTSNEIALWIAGRAVESLKSKGKVLLARPGMESPLEFDSAPPSWGSCLLYGDSGLPNQKGPLAPDKIVFRDGWETDSTYLLANLRFTGWHRYKATNTITMLYKNHPIIEEATTADTFWWLPVGRSLFRDKRIPRENLNGLSIQKTGLSAVMYALTSIGGPWAQDPPFYASVDQFELDPEKDISQSRLSDWHDWDHIRKIIFHHDGPIVVFDQANGPGNQKAAINWQVAGQLSGQDGRYRIDDASQSAEIILLPVDTTDGEISIGDQFDQSEGQQIRYQINQSGHLALVTVFLFDGWVGAEISLDTTMSPPTLLISTADKQISQPIQLSDQLD